MMSKSLLEVVSYAYRDGFGRLVEPGKLSFSAKQEESVLKGDSATEDIGTESL